jgi:hypothetical protein
MGDVEGLELLKSAGDQQQMQFGSKLPCEVNDIRGKLGRSLRKIDREKNLIDCFHGTSSFPELRLKVADSAENEEIFARG